MSTANEAIEKKKGRRAVLHHVISILSLVPPLILRRVGKTMVKVKVKVVAKEFTSLLDDWPRKFATVDSKDVAKLTRDFVERVLPYLAEINAKS